MRRDQEQGTGADELERLLAERGNWFMGIAIALTGERADAEDLLQAALEGLLRNRRRIVDTEAYLRRTLYNLAADGWRRRGTWRRKVPLLRAEHAIAVADSSADAMAAVDLRDALVRLLLRLPPRQRAVIMLRYWEQLSAPEAAEVLGCSEGTIKSAASKGLRRLREMAGNWPDAGAGPDASGAAGAGTGQEAGPEQHGPAHGSAGGRCLSRTTAPELIGLARERS
jgi:RNA polymerase sigma-70 factor (sigma-E family)